METPATPLADEQNETPRPLRDEIRDTIASFEDWSHGPDQAADAILHLLNERGHYLPGAPPAEQILADAQQFAGQLSLALLVVRLLRALESPIWTAERKPISLWLNEYIDGKNHGPVGKPMFWPSGLPGLASQLRQWGFQPTATHPPYVARVPPSAIKGNPVPPPPSGAVN
jgi:hypothetical protein